MKNAQSPPKVFLDTSALLSGLNSPYGASGFLLSLSKLGKIEAVISHEVIAEAERVIKRKFPLLEMPFLSFLATRIAITKKVTRKEIASAFEIVRSEDAPILAGAMKAKADFLITLDKKFQRLAENKTEIRVLSPGEFLYFFKNDRWL